MRFSDAAVLCFCRLAWPVIEPQGPRHLGHGPGLPAGALPLFAAGAGVRVLVLLALFVLGGLAATRAEQILERRTPARWSLTNW